MAKLLTASQRLSSCVHAWSAFWMKGEAQCKRVNDILQRRYRVVTFRGVSFAWHARAQSKFKVESYQNVAKVLNGVNQHRQRVRILQRYRCIVIVSKFQGSTLSNMFCSSVLRLQQWRFRRSHDVAPHRERGPIFLGEYILHCTCKYVLIPEKSFRS